MASDKLDSVPVDYLPGRRNIGPKECGRRRRIGFIAAAASICLFFLLLWTEAPPLTRVVLALPILVATLGFVQAASGT